MPHGTWTLLIGLLDATADALAAEWDLRAGNAAIGAVVFESTIQWD